MANPIERRRRERASVIEEARRFAEELSKVFGGLAAILYGSYARGDFNLWSDVDLIVVVRDRAVPGNPIRRLEPVLDLIPPNFEVKILTMSEFEKSIRRMNPVVLKILKEAVLLFDTIGVGKLIKGCEA